MLKHLLATLLILGRERFIRVKQVIGEQGECKKKGYYIPYRPPAARRTSDSQSRDSAPSKASYPLGLGHECSRDESAS